jgi:hypothetical protein
MGREKLSKLWEKESIVFEFGWGCDLQTKK